MRSEGLFAAELLRASTRAFAQAVVERVRAIAPTALVLPGSFASPLADNEVRLLHLAESVAVDRPELLCASARWYKIAFAHRAVAEGYLDACFQAAATVLQEELPPPARGIVARHLQAARAAAAEAPVTLPSQLLEDAPLLHAARTFLLAVLEGRGDDAVRIVRQELDRGADIASIHDHVLAKVQRELGRMWLMAEIPVADEHYGSQVVERVLSLLQERLPATKVGAPRVLTLAVAGNLHCIGIRMVAQRLQLAGYEVLHLGADMPAGDLPWLFADRHFDLAALSVSLALQVSAAAEMIRVMRSQLGTSCPRIMVGGEPFRVVPELGQMIGADASAVDAAGAVKAAQQLVSAAAAGSG